MADFMRMIGGNAISKLWNYDELFHELDKGTPIDPADIQKLMETIKDRIKDSAGMLNYFETSNNPKINKELNADDYREKIKQYTRDLKNLGDKFGSLLPKEQEEVIMISDLNDDMAFDPNEIWSTDAPIPIVKEPFIQVLADTVVDKAAVVSTELQRALEKEISTEKKTVDVKQRAKKYEKNIADDALSKMMAETKKKNYATGAVKRKETIATKQKVRDDNLLKGKDEEIAQKSEELENVYTNIIPTMVKEEVSKKIGEAHDAGVAVGEERARVVQAGTPVKTGSIRNAAAAGIESEAWPEMTEYDTHILASLASSAIAGLTGFNPYTVYITAKAATRMLRFTNPVISMLERSQYAAARAVGTPLRNVLDIITGNIDIRDVGQYVADEFFNLPLPVKAIAGSVVGGAVVYGLYSQVISPLWKWLNGKEAVAVLGVETVEEMKKEVTQSIRAMNVIKGAFGQGNVAKAYIGQAGGAAIGRRKIRNSRTADVVSPYSGNHVMYAGHSIVGYSR
jgi:hypothetical protein